MKKRQRIYILEEQNTRFRACIGDLQQRVDLLECRAKKADECRSYATATRVLSASSGLCEVYDWLDSLPDGLEAKITGACRWRQKMGGA